MTEAKICENHLKTGGEQLEFKHKVSGTNEVSSRCREVFEELKIRRKHRYIIFHIGDEAVDVESVGERGKTFQDFQRALPFTECRYAIYDHEFTTPDGRLTSKLWFLSWFPNNSTPHMKMAYTSAKTMFRDILPGVFDSQAASIEEIPASFGMVKAGDDEEEDEDFDF